MRLPQWDKDEWTIAASIATIATAIATIIAVVVAAGALYATYWVFDSQRVIQANQAAHTAVQEHMKVRVEHSGIVEIEDQLKDAEGKGDPDKLAELSERDPGQSQLYFTVAEHGIAMSEYVYKLWPDDPGWRSTVESWINVYRPYVISGEIDCGDYDQDFLQFVGDVVEEAGFCRPSTAISAAPTRYILLGVVLLAFSFIGFLAKRSRNT